MADLFRGRGRRSDRGGQSRAYGRGRGQSRGINNRGYREDSRDATQTGYAPSRFHQVRDARSVSDYTTDEVNPHLAEKFNGRSRREHANSNHSEAPKYRSAANPDIAKYVHEQRRLTESSDPESWLSCPEIPNSNEICPPEGKEIKLPANKIDRPWSKPTSYLKTHYMLLREDAVAPLREAVGRFRKDPHRMDDNDLRIYEQVRVVGFTFTFKGIATRIRFSTARSGRKILWSASKRLNSGTLVALSPAKDAFQTQCILAVVAARPLQNLEVTPPEIDLLFGDVDHHELDPQASFVMVEASQGYFEAYRHTLRALQKQSQERFPLADHICRLNTDVTAPRYLQDNPYTNMVPAADEATMNAFQRVNIIDDWPAAPSTSLDRTQWSAMRDILTNSVAIVQGPPGTGKTHVSRIAIEILVANRSVGDPPLIIACQTNHALDQILELLHPVAPGFIRLGGRSTNPLVKTRSLYEVRKNEVIEEVAGSCYNKARRDIAVQSMKLKSYLAPLLSDSPALLTAEVFFERGIINQAQFDSLKQGADQWVRSDDSATDPLESWLGKAAAPFAPVYNDESFGFAEAEEDLELEQLRELEAETGVADEEDVELLRGDFVSLNMGTTMSQPTPQTVDQAKKALDTTNNLNKIPEHLRGPVYLTMQERLKSKMRHEVCDLVRTYEDYAAQIQIGRWEKDLAYLSKAPIIGMTTTGLSKYRALVSALRPKIMLIEEAAEVLEGPVSVACVESLEHLILVGDHQQLQASCSVSGLKGEPFHLNISMFERLVRNGMPHKTLLRQRRMNKEFRELIAKTYPDLEDHDSVITRDRPQFGTGTISSWFFNHDWQELQDEHMSTFNEQEARLIAKFYRHLIRNRVPAAAITVLTFYNGQRKKILRELKDEPETASIYNKVKTVDSYQGEENMIVILSLVRNNTSGKIGFLDINNRVVVALSRAKYGFFLFGNGGFLAEHNELWDYVEEYMFQNGRSNKKIPLTCSKHGNTVWVQHPEDFDQLDGGCHLRCDGVLLCGHKCPLKCHIYPHEQISCNLPCNKELSCGHFCAKTCRDDCGCDCDAYQMNEEESHGELGQYGLGGTEGWNKFAKQPLTEENISKLPSTHDHDLATRSSGAPTTSDQQTQESKVTKPAETERVRIKANGRVRYEQHWQPQVPPSGKLARVSLQDKEGKIRESPVQQPRGPPAMGLDGTYDGKPRSPERPSNELSLLTWDSEPVVEDKAIAEWVDPETIEWEEQQKAARDDSFW